MAAEPDVPRSDAGIKVMRLRYDGTCACGRAVARGEQAGYDTTVRRVVCPACLENRRNPSTEDVLVPTPIDSAPSTAGGSLRRTHDQRAAAREARVRERFPRMGGLLLAVTPEPATTAAFAKGASGEEKAARRIIDAAGPDALFLLNRRLGAGRHDGDIDMIAVTSAGILAVDVKHYQDAKVEVRRAGGLLGPRTEALYVGGRDKTAWLAGLAKQRDAVMAALDNGPDPLRANVEVALCFVDADLPLFDRLTIGGVAIYGSRELGKRLRKATGPIGLEERKRLHARLTERLPAA